MINSEEKGNYREGHKLNNFMEWISDNLRYFILGFFVILVLVLAFLGIRFASAKLGGDTPKPQVTQGAKEQPEDEKPLEPVATTVPTQPPVATNQLEKNAYPQVNATVQKYYQALSAKDVAGIQQVADELDPTVVAKITSDQHIVGYSDVEVYTKDGVRDGEYVVLARYNYQFKDIETKVPGLSIMYVKPREDGSLYITTNGDEVQKCIEETVAEEDVKQLIEGVEGEYNKAQEQDEALRNFISGFGIASSKAAEAENGATVTIKGSCNVRDKADVSGEVVTQLTAGTQVTKLGAEGEWIQISVKLDNGEEKTGYVRSDLFE